MIQVNKIIAILALCAALFSTSACVSLTGFNTGRALPQGGGEISGNATLVETVDYNVDDTVTIIPTLYLPVLEIGGRYGIIDRLDVGLRISTSINIMLDAKYQFLGTQDSPFAMAIGAGIGFTPLLVVGITVFNFQFPLSMSYHPSEKIHLYFTPRFIHQRAGQVSTVFGSANFTGFNAGVMFGNEFKFGLDIGNYNVQGSGGKTGLDWSRKNLFNAGMGISYTFGGGKKNEEREF